MVAVEVLRTLEEVGGEVTLEAFLMCWAVAFYEGSIIQSVIIN